MGTACPTVAANTRSEVQRSVYRNTVSGHASLPGHRVVDRARASVDRARTSALTESAHRWSGAEPPFPSPTQRSSEPRTTAIPSRMAGVRYRSFVVRAPHGFAPQVMASSWHGRSCTRGRPSIRRWLRTRRSRSAGSIFAGIGCRFDRTSRATRAGGGGAFTCRVPHAVPGGPVSRRVALPTLSTDEGPPAWQLC